MIRLSSELPSECVPFSWLLGVWEGTGAVSYGDPDGPDHVEYEFGQRVAFTNDGLPWMNENAYFWRLDDERTPLAAEMGYWRLARPPRPGEVGPGLLRDATEPTAMTAAEIGTLRDGHGLPIEISVVHPDGIHELYVGAIDGPRVQVATDAVMRSKNARDYAAATRMFGLVDHQLLWAWDIAAGGHPLASHASASLHRVQGPDTSVA